MNFDDLLAPSGDTIKLSSLAVGDTLQGVLIRPAAVVPDNDFKTKEQKKSQKGALLWQFRLNLEVAGEPKTVYLSSSAYWETLNAFKAAGIRSFDDTEGGVWAIKRDEDSAPATAGFAPKKNYQVKFVAPQV